MQKEGKEALASHNVISAGLPEVFKIPFFLCLAGGGGHLIEEKKFLKAEIFRPLPYACV